MNRRTTLALAFALAVLVCLGPAAVHAKKSAKFEGLVAYKTAVDTVWDLDEENVWSNSLYAYAAGAANWGFDYSAFVSALFEYKYDVGYRNEGELFPELRELYGKFRIGKMDLYVGQQIVSWAVVDLISPLDRLNPYFYRRMLDNELAFQRLGTPMIRPILYLGPIKLEATFMPLFTPPEYEFIDDDFGILGNSFPLAMALDAFRENPDWVRTERVINHILPDWRGDLRKVLDDPAYFEQRVDLPDQDLTAPEGAVRLRATAGMVDLSAAYFALWDDIPTLHLNPELVHLDKNSRAEDGYLVLPNPDEIEFELLCDPFRITHHRLHAVGLGASTYVHDIGLRAEAVHNFDRWTYRRDLEAVRADMLEWVATIDYTFSGDLMLGGMLYQEYTFGHEEDFWQPAWIHRVAVAARRPFLDEKLTTEASFMVDLSTQNGADWRGGDWGAGGWLYYHIVNYSLTDRLKVGGGVNLLGGDDDTLIGWFSGNSRVFALVRYGF